MPGRARKPVVSDRVTAADIIAFTEQTCFVPEGKFVGQRLKLAPFQKELIGAIYDNPTGTRRVIMGTAFYQVATLSVDVLLTYLGNTPTWADPNINRARPVRWKTLGNAGISMLYGISLL